MVKVQKPIPKTIKKNVSKSKKIQFNTSKTNSAKEVAKKVMKTLTVVDTNNAEKVKTENGNLNKKNELSGKIKGTIAKRNPLVQKSLKIGKVKNTSTLTELPKPVKKIEAKKKTAVTKSPSLEELSVAVKKFAPKKKLLEGKVQKTAKNSIVQNKSALNGESEKIRKNLPKKKQVVAKVQKPAEAMVQPVVKKPLKKISVFDGETGKVVKDLSKKYEAVEKVHQPVVVKMHQMAKKPLKNKFAPENKKPQELSHKGPVAAKAQQPLNKFVFKNQTTDHEAEHKLGKKPLTLKMQDKVGLGGQKKLKSKVQKKLSAEKKNDLNLKHKVKKNVQNILQKEEKELPTLEPEDFDENKFKNILSLENIEKICKALKVLVQNEVTGMKTAIFGEYNYFLNVACYKIPNCPKRMVKLNLKHGNVDPTVDDVVLIVPDLKRGANVDYELTIQHYDDVLRKHGVENIKILPFNQLRKEYSSYEAKIKLSNTYDHFLCDGRIVGHVVGFCGKTFNKPRSTFHAVNLSDPKTYKTVFERALKRTAYRQLQKGDLSSILVGNHRLTEDQLAENIVIIIKQLKTIFPGGYPNIRNIHIKIDIRGTSSLPLYVSMIGPPDEVPNIIGQREQKMLNLKKQANDILSKFNMSKTGDFVKLNKKQIKRKQEIRETREALTCTEIASDEDGGKLNPPSKKKPKNQVEPQNVDNSDLSDNDDDISIKNGEVSDIDDASEEDGDEVSHDDNDVNEEDGEGNDETSDEDVEESDEDVEEDDDDVDEGDEDEENPEDGDEDDDENDEEDSEECSEDDDE